MWTMRRGSSAIALGALLALAGCGGGNGGTATGNSIASVSITPTNAIVRTNGIRGFSYQILGTGNPDPRVTWSADNGTIDNNGVFTANGGQSTAHITVSSIADPTK